MNEEKLKKLIHDVYDNVAAYREFIKEMTGSDSLPVNLNVDKVDLASLPLCDKQNYLLRHDVRALSREGDLNRIHLIGASSGFSSSGAVHWPKCPEDERGYMESIETMFIHYYNIDTRRTLVIECLALGLWIGGMQLAAALRHIAIYGGHPFTICTPGLDLRSAVDIMKEYDGIFDQVLILTNPSNIPLITALMEDTGLRINGGNIYFPVVGEYYTEQFREQTAKRFGHSTDDPFVVWTGYGSADTGLIGTETTATIALRKFFFHHPELSLQFFGTESTPMLLQLSDECRIEIVDGQIVCTKNQFFPLIRYNTKDSGILLSKCDLHDIIPDSLYATLPDEILCVMGRVDNQIVFYGTNLNVNDIAEHLLTLPSDYGYGGLYTVQERIVGGVQTYHFVFYVKDIDKCASAVRFLDAVVDYARGNNAEFNYKYGNLTQSATVPLLSAEIADIDRQESDINIITPTIKKQREI